MRPRRLARRDLIGLLGSAPVEQDQVSIDRLLLAVPTDLWDARQSIFVCAECGDIRCGAITADVQRADGKYVWSNFAFESNYDKTMTDRETVAHLGPFVFDAAQYSNALMDALRQERRNS
jgi:hypothetical protein